MQITEPVNSLLLFYFMLSIIFFLGWNPKFGLVW